MTVFEVTGDGSQTLPSHTQITYGAPSLPVLLSLSTYLYLLSATSTLAGNAIHAPLIGPFITGILLGPSLAGLLSPSTQQCLISLGYIGLILIVFEAGLTTHIPLLIENIGVSTAAALTGVLLPIALSIVLLHGAYGYTTLQAFAAGAALCSTSLGTTLALLTPRLRKTRVGSVLMCAALLDDVVGLVIAGITANLANSEDNGVSWQTVVRPILVSIAFGLGTPELAWAGKKIIGLDWGCSGCQSLRRIGQSRKKNSTRTWIRKSLIYDSRTQLFLIVFTLSAFVAGSSYAGTSELFGAYLAGTFLAHVFNGRPQPSDAEEPPIQSNGSVDINQKNLVESNSARVAKSGRSTSSTPDESNHFEELEPLNSSLEAFTEHILPILTPLLGPVFFASVGAALPIGSLFTTTVRSGSGSTKSYNVVWRGIVYALVMACTKAAVGLCILFWRDVSGSTKGTNPSQRKSEANTRDSKLGLEATANVGEDGPGHSNTTTMSGKPENTTRPDNGSTMGLADRTEIIPASDGATSSHGIRFGRIYAPKSLKIPLKIRSASMQMLGRSDLEKGRTPGDSTLTPNAHICGENVDLNKRVNSPDADKSDSKLKSLSSPRSDEPTPRRAALLLGLAMIARGEIALIVAQLARPLLLGKDGFDEEPFAVVIWAVVVCTVGGAVGVGVLLGKWEKEEALVDYDPVIRSLENLMMRPLDSVSDILERADTPSELPSFQRQGRGDNIMNPNTHQHNAQQHVRNASTITITRTFSQRSSSSAVDTMADSMTSTYTHLLPYILPDSRLSSEVPPTAPSLQPGGPSPSNGDILGLFANPVVHYNTGCNPDRRRSLPTPAPAPVVLPSPRNEDVVAVTTTTTVDPQTVIISVSELDELRQRIRALEDADVYMSDPPPGYYNSGTSVPGATR